MYFVSLRKNFAMPQQHLSFLKLLKSVNFPRSHQRFCARFVSTFFENLKDQRIRTHTVGTLQRNNFCKPKPISPLFSLVPCTKLSLFRKSFSIKDGSKVVSSHSAFGQERIPSSFGNVYLCRIRQGQLGRQKTWCWRLIANKVGFALRIMLTACWCKSFIE